MHLDLASFKCALLCLVVHHCFAPPDSIQLCLTFDALCRSVVDFAKAFKAKNLPLNVLVGNAGVFLVPHDHTEEGFEVCQYCHAQPMRLICLGLADCRLHSDQHRRQLLGPLSAVPLAHGQAEGERALPVGSCCLCTQVLSHNLQVAALHV